MKRLNHSRMLVPTISAAESTKLLNDLRNWGFARQFTHATRLGVPRVLSRRPCGSFPETQVWLLFERVLGAAVGGVVGCTVTEPADPFGQ